MSDFDEFWDNDDNFPDTLPFPGDHKELAEWCKTAYEAGRKAGLEEAVRTIELEQEKIIHSPMFIGMATTSVRTSVTLLLLP